MPPIWMPPLSFATLLTILCIVGAAQADKLPSVISTTLLHPVGFILTVLIAISLYEYKSIPLAVSLILLLLRLVVLLEINLICPTLLLEVPS